MILVAVISGILGGMGMGGGTLYIPALTLLFGVGQRMAQWLNLVSFIPMAVVSLFIHAKNHRLDLKAFLWLFVPASLSAVAFAYLATIIKGRILSLLFALFLVGLGITGLIGSLVRAIAKWRADTPKEPADQ